MVSYLKRESPKPTQSQFARISRPSTIKSGQSFITLGAGKAPWAAEVGRTATVKRTKLDASPELNLHREVQKQFTEQGLLMYYSGEVIATPTTTKGKYTLRYTDAYEKKVTHQELGELLYKASTRIDQEFEGVFDLRAGFLLTHLLVIRELNTVEDAGVGVGEC